jgi:hypothetical protein
MIFSKEQLKTLYLCFKTFISLTIQAFGTTVPFSRIENENLKIKLTSANYS